MRQLGGIHANLVGSKIKQQKIWLTPIEHPAHVLSSYYEPGMAQNTDATSFFKRKNLPQISSIYSENLSRIIFSLSAPSLPNKICIIR